MKTIMRIHVTKDQQDKIKGKGESVSKFVQDLMVDFLEGNICIKEIEKEQYVKTTAYVDADLMRKFSTRLREKSISRDETIRRLLQQRLEELD